MKRIVFFLALVLLFAPASLQAQAAGSFDWFPGGTYDSSIPTPAYFLGYKIGQNMTLHHELEGYLKAVAQASDRVTYGTYGKTNEGRDLILLTITSPENHARIDEIRQNMGRLADPRGAAQSDLDAIIEENKT